MDNSNNTNNNSAEAASEAPKPNTNNNNNDSHEHEETPDYATVEERPQEQREDRKEEDGGDEEGRGSDVEQPPQQPSQPSRTPFTNLSQVDADLALARTLQEQERAYMMLRMNNEGSDYGSWEAGSYIHDDEDDFDDPNDDTDGADEDEEEEDAEEGEEGFGVDDDEDAFDVHAHEESGEDNNPNIEFDPAVYSSDEAYARALQDAEEREMAARLLALAGINDLEVEYMEDHGGNSQCCERSRSYGPWETEKPQVLSAGRNEDAWEEVDPDELSYEELIALGEVVGTESRGLSADTIASLPSVNYKSGTSQNGSNESCVICRVDYEDGETLTVLSCKHSYHSECINNWLKINKVCPVCSTEVSMSGNSK